MTSTPSPGLLAEGAPSVKGGSLSVPSPASAISFGDTIQRTIRFQNGSTLTLSGDRSDVIRGLDHEVCEVLKATES